MADAPEPHGLLVLRRERLFAGNVAPNISDILDLIIRESGDGITKETTHKCEEISCANSIRDDGNSVVHTN
jgi:hypothetical protein